MSATLACPNCAYTWKPAAVAQLDCPRCGNAFSADAGGAAVAADRRLLRRRLLGALFVIFTLVALGATGFFVFLYFAPRDAHYARPIIVIGSVMFAATLACGYTAYRLLAKRSGASLWPLAALGVLATLVVLFFLSRLGH